MANSQVKDWKIDFRSTNQDGTETKQENSILPRWGDASVVEETCGETCVVRGLTHPPTAPSVGRCTGLCVLPASGLECINLKGTSRDTSLKKHTKTQTHNCEFQVHETQSE